MEYKRGRTQLLIGSEDTSFDYDFDRGIGVNKYEPGGASGEGAGDGSSADMHGGFWTDMRLKDLQRRKHEELYDPSRENLQLGAGLLPRWARVLVFSDYGPLSDSVPQETLPEDVNFSLPLSDEKLKRKYHAPTDFLQDRLLLNPEQEENTSNRYDFGQI